MPKILFVCTANICRSPLAEGMLRAALIARGAPASFSVDSCGTQALVGQAPAPHSIAVAASYGADISQHLARELDTADFQRFDWMFAMDYGHLDFLNAVQPAGARARISLLPMADGRDLLEIGDPYGGPKRDYERAGRLIAGAIEVLLPRLLAQA